MKKPPLSHKVRIVGRLINIYAKTDIAATFKRVKAEQAAAAAEVKEKVLPMKRRAK